VHAGHLDIARWPAGRPPRWTWPAPLASGVWPIRLSKCALTCHKSGRRRVVVTASQESDKQCCSCPRRRCLRRPADDVAALADVPAVDSFIAVGYSMGGMVAQLVYRRHSPMTSGLVLCATARNVLGSSAEKLAALALPSGGRRHLVESAAAAGQRRDSRPSAAGSRR